MVLPVFYVMNSNFYISLFSKLAQKAQNLLLRAIRLTQPIFSGDQDEDFKTAKKSRKIPSEKSRKSRGSGLRFENPEKIPGCLYLFAKFLDTFYVLFLLQSKKVFSDNKSIKNLFISQFTLTEV